MDNRKEDIRIVSLLPAATETICAIGMRDRLVGRSHECDFPPGIETLPVCSRPRYNPEGPSPDIDREVTAVLREALSIYRVEVGAIRELKPTHIVTQSQCRVCAVSTDEIRNSLREVTGMERIELVDLNPETLDGVLDSVKQVAAALGAGDEGMKLTGEMSAAFARLREKSEKSSHSPTVAQIEWIEPLMTAGHWMPELIGISGGVNVFRPADGPRITFDDLARTDPEVLLVAPCGFTTGRSMEDMPYLSERPGWKSLRAVREGRVYVCDGSQYFSRPGPRLVDSAEILSEIFLPHMFPPRHRGAGWTRIEKPYPAG